MYTSSRCNLQTIKKAALTLLTFCFLTAAFSQGNGGRPPGNGNGGDPPGKGHGKGGNSNDNNPNASGMIRSSEHLSTTMLTPTAWGSTEKFAFFTFGGTPKQLYGTTADLSVRTGLGIGNANKNVSVVGFVNVYDVSSLAKLQLRDVTYSLIASRSLGSLGSLSAGVLNSFSDTSVTDGVQSMYVAYSWAPKGLRSVTPGNPRLSLTVGAGNGKFYRKSMADIQWGRGYYGTAVFANLSYDVIKNLSVNAEWTGLNAGLTAAYQLPKNIASVYAGVANLTRYSGDRATFVFGVGRTFGLTR